MLAEMRFTRRNAGCSLSGRNANEIAKNYEFHKYLTFLEHGRNWKENVDRMSYDRNLKIILKYQPTWKISFGKRLKHTRTVEWISIMIFRNVTPRGLVRYQHTVICMSDSRRGFGLDLLITLTQLVTTLNYSAIADFHTLQIIRAHAKSSPACSILTRSFLVTAPTVTIPLLPCSSPPWTAAPFQLPPFLTTVSSSKSTLLYDWRFTAI
jgi:hypothetical protein